jgi:hypothetical protein
MNEKYIEVTVSEQANFTELLISQANNSTMFFLYIAAAFCLIFTAFSYWALFRTKGNPTFVKIVLLFFGVIPLLCSYYLVSRIHAATQVIFSKDEVLVKTKAKLPLLVPLSKKRNLNDIENFYVETVKDSEGYEFFPIYVRIKGEQNQAFLGLFPLTDFPVFLSNDSESEELCEALNSALKKHRGNPEE